MMRISSVQNPVVRRLLRLRDDPSYRRESGSILVEGKKLVLEALDRGGVVQCFIQEDLSLDGVESTVLTSGLIQKISDLKSPEGYFACVPYPENASLEGCSKVLVLDQVQNPNNMGALIRSAVAFGFEGIFIVKGSCDPYSPKVLRASMGGALDIPICQGSYEDLEQLSTENKAQVLVADMGGTPIEEMSIKKPFMLVLGNESKGSTLTMDPSFKKVSLPTHVVDSLNVAVAGSLLMYLVRGAS